MVNTRHSINASHEDEDLKSVNGNCVKIAGKKIDKEEDLPLEVDKSQKGKKANELFESFNYDAIQRRSIRHQQRSLNHIGKSRRSLKHVPALRFASHGSSYVRRSDRRIKRVFETFNEQEIYRTIEKKHQEMLEMDQGSMYDVIKRRRGESDTQDDEDGTANEVEDSDGDDEEDEEDEEVELQPAYCLRKKKPKTNKYQAPINNGRPRRDILYAGSQSPLKIHHVKRIPQHSSPHHHCRRSRRSSSTSSSDDEARFERRKSKSMAISRARCLPMNFKEKDLVGILKDRSRAREESNLGSSLADVDPMTVDTKTSFADIGGLDKHIRSLKEMIVFPLLYPEVFAKFNITPPRGVLFYGPPGTGKTLVARALANECSRDGQKVAFFMRKGADCLSKWVGESERQLRLLFDQAYTMRPSIIFFDEIDGIAPVRSTRQDQIHSSIVSTLLALMDGLDARGEIVIIGATNRLDSIDPALRRPGRFDREFLFGLPDKFAREKILTIHTSEWQPKLSPEFIRELAEKCVGYCGADIKGLCTEAALLALRRRYPQIYETNKKLVLNTKEIKISSIDFKNAMKRITPASSRSSLLLSRALPLEVKPLLNNCVTKILELLNNIFPAGMHNNDSDESSCSENEDIFEHSTCNQRTSQITNESSSNYMLLNKKVSYKSRLLVYGHAGNGQSSYICPALLHSMEHLSSFNIDLPSIAGNSSRTPEEALSQIFLEARKSVPSIIYLPHIDAWFSAMSDVACATFLTLLNDTPADLPILLLSTAETNWYNLPEEIQNIFSKETQTFHVTFPSDSERYDYFKDTFLLYALKKSVKKSIKKEVHKEVLLEATPPKPRELSANEAMLLQETEEATLRELRVFLRQVTWKLLADRKFKEFSKPVDLEEVNDYLQVVKEPMDLSTVMTRINSHYYESCSHYLKDIDLIMNNCLEYNPDKDQFDKLLRNRACEMKDVANALIYADLDPEFEKLCLEISESRKKRGVKSNGPAFMKVMPQYKRSSNNVSNQSVSDINDTPDKNSIPDVAGTRFSHRVRGLNDGIDVDLNTLNMLEGRKRKFQTKKSFDKESEREVNSPAKQTKSQQSIGGEINESLTSVPEPFRNEKKSNTQVTELLRDSTSLLTQLVDGTKYWNIDRLERLYARLKHCIIQNLKTEDRSLVLKSLKDIVESIENK